MPKYSIIIPVVFKDYSFLKKSFRYILKNLDPVRVYIITDSSVAKYLPKQVKNCDICEILDENKIIDGLSYNIVDSIIRVQKRHHTKAGWYFQQFLKMGFAQSDYCDTDYYLSWDSDTIPLKRLSFFDDDAHPYFTMKSEYHKPYFETMEKILNIGKTNSCSYISEHMMFNRYVMDEMIDKIMHSDVKGDMWYAKIMYSLVPESVSPFSFSEFETYGSYCKVYHPNLYKERRLSSYRKAGLIQGRFISDLFLQSLSEDADIASFEIYDHPPFPWGKMSYWYARWQCWKELFIRRWLI